MKAVLEKVSLQLIASAFVYHRHYSHGKKLLCLCKSDLWQLKICTLAVQCTMEISQSKEYRDHILLSNE